MKGILNNPSGPVIGAGPQRLPLASKEVVKKLPIMTVRILTRLHNNTSAIQKKRLSLFWFCLPEDVEGILEVILDSKLSTWKPVLDYGKERD
ncbi:hypothetical protein C5167_046339 [Papaver somniferum]|uniref:Uncharacterized protein n=1 Tax=Papaver somniferum TaxID=3469 RepID=A0A4Y7LFT4_PAPSO|nr:hypothetical protein C5167_046339 [Papaver somniferum]